MGNQQCNNRKRLFKFTQMNEDLAYLLGVLLGDGWLDITDNYSLFGLATIDKEFAERVREIIIRLFKTCPNITSRCRDTAIGGRFYKSTFYELRAGLTDFNRWAKEVTQSKKIIPLEIHLAPLECKKSFIEGMMDSEGWIATYTRPDLKKPLYRIGFACINELVTNGLKNIFNFIGVQTTGPNKAILRSGKTLYTLWVNKYDFVSHGLKFTIQRKQKRLVKFAEEYSVYHSTTERRIS